MLRTQGNRLRGEALFSVIYFLWDLSEDEEARIQGPKNRRENLLDNGISAPE
jgi:hypothetical protein